MPDETITLRDAALRIARIKNLRAKINTDRLLSLLRSGQLNAGFYFLDGSVWIEIPSGYWSNIGSNKFNRTVRRNDDPRSGAFTVQAAAFSEQIARFIEIGGSLEGQPVAAIVSAAARSYEVVVKDSEFSRYLQEHKLEEREAISSVGRRRKEGWRELCSYMAAYFAAHRERLKIEQAKTDIIKIARDDHVAGLPSEETIKEQIHKAIALLEKPEFKSKT